MSWKIWYPSLMGILLLQFVTGCAIFERRGVKDSAKLPMSGPRSFSTDKRLAQTGLRMLNRGEGGFNPEKGKAYLEYSLKGGNLKVIEVPAAVLLEMLRSERVALEKSRTLEQQLEIMKEIDLMRDRASTGEER